MFPHRFLVFFFTIDHIYIRVLCCI